MSELISQWIQNRLGLIVDMSPESFAVKTADGRLLVEILYSYSFIALEQLNLITKSNFVSDCYENFKYIRLWLSDLHIALEDEDIYEIVHGVGTASLHLFYQVYLEFRNKSKLDIVMENEFKSQLGTKQTRFEVTKLPSEVENKYECDLLNKDACTLAMIGGDAYHWYKDRMETLQSRCKEARDEYMHTMMSLCKSGVQYGVERREFSLVLPRSLVVSPRQSVNLDESGLPEDDISIQNRSYETLMKLQEKNENIEPIKPDWKIAKKITKDIKTRNLGKQENKIIRTELHLEILNEFEKKLNENKAKSEDKVITDILLRQSNFEKLLMSKMGQIKIQKEFMLENKFIQGDKLNKIKEREFVNALLVKDKDLNERKLIYYLERDRLLQLHQRIWNERLRLRTKRHEEMCASAVKDMADISMRIVEYKKRFGQEPSEREMREFKNIFVAGQPIFDSFQPIVRIIEDKSEDVEEEIASEIIRQNAIDKEEFDNYVNCEWPWELKNVPVAPETLDQIVWGLNVLGHIVHQVLAAKYPLPPAPEIPRFPEATVRACINGYKDISTLSILRRLLAHREIEVIELTQAVNYCIEAFYNESKREYDIEKSAVDKEIKKTKVKPPKTAKKGTKSKSKGRSTKSVINEEVEAVEPTKTFDNKIVQTPIKFPWEEIDYSPQGALGKTAQELLEAGQALTDFLLVAMFVEYLKSIPNLKGWALINFPCTFDQAAILEQAFTGINILDAAEYADTKTILDIVELSVDDDKDECSLATQQMFKRKSQLLPVPYQTEPVVVYDTFLTAYIKLKPFENDDNDCETTLPPGFEELEDNPDPLDKFYSDIGANYSMYYKDFDSTTIKYLGKLVIGDYSLPLKSSIELFGDVNDKETKAESTRTLKSAKKGEKVKKPRPKADRQAVTEASGSEKAPKNKKGGQKNIKVVIVHEDKSVQVPEEDEEIEEVFVSEECIPPTPTPGQPGWDYVVLPMSEEYMTSLATLWETVEEIYINDLKQLFFLKRTKMNLIVPFALRIKNTMGNILDRPDYKGYYLAKFQKAFNAFDMDFRKDDEFKAEMYCRILDFQEKMLEMCDEKMIVSENSRCKIIKANWAPKEICALLNDYVNMLQIELDRFLDSIWLIDNYFSGIFTNKPVVNEISNEDNLPKISFIDIDAVNVTFEQRDSRVDLTYFSNIFNDLFQKANACIKRYASSSQTNQDRFKSMISESTKSKSKTVSPKSRDEKHVYGLDNDLVKENFPKLLDEWQCAVKGETQRVSLRLELLKINALEAIEEFIQAICIAFHEVYDEIRTKYRRETESIQRACQLFRTAVEQEKPLQKELLFDGDAFYVNPDVHLFENRPIIPDLSEKVVEEGAFTVAQLSKLIDILLDISPTGYIPTTSFIYLLQDIAINEGDFQSGSMMPSLWGRLNSKGFKTVVEHLFDPLEYLYWRDFIVYNLRLPFPSENELILTRTRLRICDPDCTELVHDYQFYGTKLWFELIFKNEERDKIEEIKRLLMKMYRVNNEQVNYTALLLDFCKDDDPLIGFAKALELSLGKIVCWNKDIGNAFKEEYLKGVAEHDERVRLRDAEREDHYNAIRQGLNELVDQIVHAEEDVIIEDVTNTETKTRRGSILKKHIIDEKERKRISKDEDVKFKEEDDIKYIDDNQDKQSDIAEDVTIFPALQDKAGKEASDYTQIAVFLPLDILITVITASLPWHSRVQYYGDSSFWEQAARIHAQLENPTFNMSVLTHDYLNNDDFLKLLGMTTKFTAKDPVRIVKKILDERD